MNARTMRFPGSFLYYLFFGGYLSALALLERTSSVDHRSLVIEKLRWTDLSAYLSWILRHLGLPRASAIALEGRLLGIVGVIEPRMSEFLKTKYGRVFVDVGAYHGHYSLLLSRNFIQVIALEPVPKNADFLRAVVISRKADNIRIIRMAASARGGPRQLRVMPQLSESKLESPLGSAGGSITVKTVSLDSLLNPFGEVDLIKLDVEGEEFDVLEGASDSMGKIHSWLIELHNQSAKPKLESYMARNGYDLFWLDRGHLFANRKVENAQSTKNSPLNPAGQPK